MRCVTNATLRLLVACLNWHPSPWLQMKSCLCCPGCGYCPHILKLPHFFPTHSVPVDRAASAFAAGGPFTLASDEILNLLTWLWPLTHAPGRRAAALARQLHQRLCLEVEAAAAEAAGSGGAPAAAEDGSGV